MSGSRLEDSTAEFARSLPMDKILSAYADCVNRACEEETGAEVQKAVGSAAKITLKHNGNNVILEANKGDKKLILQLCESNIRAESAANALYRHDWLAKSYHSQVQQAEKPGDMYSLRVMEYCPANAGQLAKRARDNSDPEYSTQFAAKTGLAISTMLTDIRSQNMIWTDLKPGNVLFRGNGKAVITDSKAISHIDNLPRLKSGNVKFEDVSPQFCSRHFMENIDNISPDKVQAVMEKEYSYQMAVQLYCAATNDEESYLALRKRKEGSNFDFDKHAAIFSTGSGKVLKTMIQELGREDPEKRIDIRVANVMLQNALAKSEQRQPLPPLRGPAPPITPSIKGEIKLADASLAEQLQAKAAALKATPMKPAVSPSIKSTEGMSLVNQLKAKSAKLNPVSKESVRAAPKPAMKAVSTSTPKSAPFKPPLPPKLNTQKSTVSASSVSSKSRSAEFSGQKKYSDMVKMKSSSIKRGDINKMSETADNEAPAKPVPPRLGGS